jgi:hypothetical protein
MQLVANQEVQVVELIALTDTPAGVELRFRHFAPDLTAYEGTFKQALLLSGYAADTSVFQNTVPYDSTLMSTQPRVTRFIRRGPNDFVGQSDIIDHSGKPGVVESTYHRVR